MFDVIWTDPNVEHVGQRKLRKEQEAKNRDKKKTDSGRQSVSTASSASSERGFGLFASKPRKGTPTPSSNRVKPETSVGNQGEGDDVKTQRTSAYGVKATLAERYENATAKTNTDWQLHPEPPLEAAETYSGSHRADSVMADSVLSRWAQQAAVATGAFDRISANNLAAESKTQTYVQDLGPSSFVTRVIETTVSPRTEADGDRVVIETHISSEATKSHTPPLPDVPEDESPTVCEASESFPSPYICPQTPPPIDYRGSPLPISPAFPSHDRTGNPEAWKPPHEWDCTPPKQSAISMNERLRMSQASPEPNNPMFPGLAALQRELRMMAAASPELMLANMKSSMGEASDATVYKELEMTKKRWMFSALHQQSGYAQLMEQGAESTENSSPVKRSRILALYETQASASFIAALYPTASITHISPNPISPNLYPSVQPLLVPSVSIAAASRALAPQLYSTVTCLSMPALFPSTDIPPFLRHINRCLAPGGSLHLTIIDPQPVSASMGPKLRQWLFTHLLINLEQAFRTTWPSETFPAWLAVGHLRGKGSTIATITVPAIPESPDKTDVKTELRCFVTRLLWQEVWGGFVHASKWWWEEEEIVRECLSLGTHWQYSHIIAVKEDA
ncbi:hypothetical protein F5Y17DRAFT_473208 [Xylariaceae sp. FL0594]|nr:hypothetical protein F5Y17DRAFT_473208 [Xylariaceae sp. FL0594]